MRLKVVLHILWDGSYGGAQKFASDIVSYSDKSRFEHVVVFLAFGGSFGDQMISNGAKVYCLGMENGLSIAKALKLSGLISKIRPDIIHNHARNYLANMIILKFRDIPKLYFEHGGDLIKEGPKREVVFYNLFGRFYDLILANSDYVRQEIIRLTRVRADQVKKFYIGIDPEMYKEDISKNDLRAEFGLSRDDKVIGAVGRIVAQKGFNDFVNVAVEMKKMRKGFSFVIVGDGPLKPELMKMAKDAGVDVHFLGDRKDVPRILRLFDLFMITSKWEPFGIVVLEAIVSKIPVVGFSVPGMKEIFEKGGGGILMEGRDPRKLAEVAVSVLSDEKLRTDFAEEGFKNVQENFNIRKNIRILEEHYLSVLDGRPKPLIR